MEKIINYENLRNFAYSNDKICEGEIKGIVLQFFGLGGKEMYAEDTESGLQNTASFMCCRITIPGRG